MLQSSQPASRRALLDQLTSVLRVLPFDAECARQAASVSASLRKVGTPIGPVDTLIAGTALAYGATLVTHDTSEFARVDGLILDDWF